MAEARSRARNPPMSACVRRHGACLAHPRWYARELCRKKLLGKPIRIAIGAEKLVTEREVITVIISVAPMMDGMASGVIDDRPKIGGSPPHAIVNHHRPEGGE